MRKLFTSLLGMNLQLFAEDGAGGGAGSGGQNGASGGSDGAGSGSNPPEGNGGDNGQKTFTQADVDKMIQERLGRESKKMQKAMDDLKKQLGAGGDAQGNADAGGQQGAGQQQGAQTSEETLKAQALVAAANQRLVQATAVAEAVKLGVDPKYTADVVKLADLSKIEVKDDGTMDTGAISKALDDVVKRVPVFKVTDNNAGGFRVGGEGQRQQSNNGWNSTQQTQSVKPWNRNR